MSELRSNLQTNTNLPEQLSSAVAELYAAFRRRKLSEGGPDACTYCCASPEAMARIAHSSPERISYSDLSEYHCAAKGDGAGQDLAFLLPRTLEFVAAGSDLNSSGLFALFARYLPPMWEDFDDRERGAVRRYFHELILWRLTSHADVLWDYDAIELLEMAASSGFDVDPVLDVLADPPDTVSAMDLMIDLVLNHANLWKDSRGLYEVSDPLSQHVSKRLHEIISSSTVINRLERIALADGDNGRAYLASLAHQIAEYEATTRTLG
jgi:hypothetical protein